MAYDSATEATRALAALKAAREAQQAVDVRAAARSELAAKPVAADAAMQDLCAKERIHTTSIDKDTPHSVLGCPVRMSGDGRPIVMLTDSEQQDLHSDADKTCWQGQSIPSSNIGGSALGALSSSIGPHHISKTKGKAVHMLQLLCTCDKDGVVADVFADEGDDAFPPGCEDGFADEGDDDYDYDKFPTDAQLALALRTVFARKRRHLSLTRRTLSQKNETELGGADLSICKRYDRVIKTSIALTKDEEAEAKAARGRHADDKPTTPVAAHAVAFSTTLSTMSIEYFDDGAREDLAVDVATRLGVPRDGVRVTSAGAHGGSIIIETSVIVDDGAEAAAAFASMPTDPAIPLIDEFHFGPCAVSGVRDEESAAAAAAAPAGRPAEPAPPLAPAMTDKRPLRAIDVVFNDDDDNRHPAEQIEGRDSGLWDFAVSDDDSELDGEEEEAVRQGSYFAPWDRGGASAAAAAADVGLQRRRMIGGNFTPHRHTPVETDTPNLQTSVEIDVYIEEHADVLTRRAESPSPAPDDASATGCTYGDITRSPPPHLRCVVSLLSSLPPVLRYTAASPPCFLSRAVLVMLFARQSFGCLVLDI